MGQIPRALLFVAAAVAVVGVAVAVETRQFLALGIVAALIGFFGVTTLVYSRAATAVRSLKNVPLRLEIWGTPLGSSRNETYRLDMVQAFGAGLLVWATSNVNDQRIFVKVAQPRDVRHHEKGVTVGWAKYVQVNKSTVPVVRGAPALNLFHSTLRI